LKGIIALGIADYDFVVALDFGVASDLILLMMYEVR
jgi:hypothetical protein